MVNITAFGRATASVKIITSTTWLYLCNLCWNTRPFKSL